MPIYNAKDDNEIELLIEECRIISNQQLIFSFNDFNKDSYRILNRPLPDMIIEDLKTGSWTVTELSEKYGIQRKDISEIINSFFKNSHFFIEEHKYIPRRIGRDECFGKGTNIRYSLIPIPIHARLFDITLGMSLLGWDEKIQYYDEKIEYISSNSIINEYCAFTTDYWEIPIDKVLSYFSKENIIFIMSSCGPLPFLKDITYYSSIKKQLSVPPNFLRFQFFNSNFKKFKNLFLLDLNEGINTFSEIQYYVILLSDAINYYKSISDIPKVKELEKINEHIFNMIFILED